MRLVPTFAVLAALALAPAAAMAQDSTTANRPRATRTPHPTANRGDCLRCHGPANADSVKAVPAEHDYPIERCVRCHRPAETMPVQSEHAFDERHAQCATCHVAGNTENAKPTPAESHSRFRASWCVMCHEQRTAPAPG
jgi:predicted CXXCH cytochrome family protein